MSDKQVYHPHHHVFTKKQIAIRHIINIFSIIAGTAIAAAGLEFFLIPKEIIDGGVVGISLIISYLMDFPLGLLTFVLNVPFLLIGYKQIGKTFVVYSIIANALFSFWVSLFKAVEYDYSHSAALVGIHEEILLCVAFGGVMLGIGVGLVLRSGGAIDGTETMAIILNKGTNLSVGQWVMLFNIFIFGAAIFLLSPENGMYSILAYFIAFKCIDMIVQGLDESRAVMIMSSEWEEISDAIQDRLGRTVTLLRAEGYYKREEVPMVYSIVTKIEIAKIKSIITEIDENAFVAINSVSDVISKTHKKHAIH